MTLFGHVALKIAAAQNDTTASDIGRGMGRARRKKRAALNQE
jgi:uncharacterized membrane protein